jgi:putative flippase GtrA
VISAALARNEKLRFLVAGATTTLATYVLYWLLLGPIGARIAYATAYASGIVLSYTLSSRWVFRGSWTSLGLASFTVGYGVQAAASYLLFLAVLAFTPTPEWLAPVLVTMVMLPATYLINRALILRTSPRPDPGKDLR